jgi:transposase
VTRGRLTEGFWIEQFQKDHRPPSDVWADIQDGLANQLAGHEWRVKGMVPKLEKWLRDGLWRQRHDPEPPAAERMTRSTATTFGAAAEILNAPDVPGTDRR